MTDDRLKTLFHPFETGDLPVPSKGTRVLFLGAEPGFRLPAGFAADLAPVHVTTHFTTSMPSISST